MKRYDHAKYNARHRGYRLAYYKRPDVRKRIRDRYNSDPLVVAKREARMKWRLERAAYRKSQEFKDVLKERNRLNWMKRKATGKTKVHDRKRWKENLEHRLGQNMRRLIHSVLVRQSGLRKSARTFELIGCSIVALKLHLGSQFSEDMSWENYGSYWHVDHRLPLALFDLRDARQQKLAFHFENLRPFPATRNLSKSDKVGEIRARDIRKIIQFKAA